MESRSDTVSKVNSFIQKKLRKRKAPIKTVIIDQALIAGIGNMYADEALFAAGINPLRSADSLSRIEINRLHGAIQAVLRDAIDSKGASVSTYFRPVVRRAAPISALKLPIGRAKLVLFVAPPLSVSQYASAAAATAQNANRIETELLYILCQSRKLV